MDIYSLFFSFIKQYALFQSGDRVVAGISGGADSIALLDLLNRLSQDIPLYIAVACLDHGIREESKQEAKWVGECTQKYGFPFYTHRVELGKENKTGIEERARHVRYSFLSEVAEKFQATKIVVAHHADDQVETILHRFFKGTGVHGLSGMPIVRSLFPRSCVSLIRPLLCLRKSQILSYLRQKGLEWCEDASNLDLRFTRNRIRHRILPFLEQEGYPQIMESILSLAQYSQENSEYMNKQAESFFSQYVKNSCPDKPHLSKFFFLLEGKECAKVLLSNALRLLPSALIPYLFHKIFASLNISLSLRSSHYQRIAQLIQEENGIIEMPQNVKIYKTPYSMSIVLPFVSDSYLPHVWDVPGTLSCSNHAFLDAKKEVGKDFDLDFHRKDCDPLSIAISADTSAIPFAVRFCNSEDSIQLLGAPGIKKIARILSDLKVPLPMRQRMILVTDNQNYPLWLPGIGIAHRVRINENTKEIWKLSMQAKSP